MNERLNAWTRPCTLVYLVLMGLTLATFTIGTLGYSGLGASLLVLGFALLKVGLIGDWFMGLREVRGPWRWPILVWLLLVGGLIGLAFYWADGP